MKQSLTKKFIDCIPFTVKGQKIYWDDKIPGFGLRVGQRSKTFFVQTQVKDSRQKRGYKTAKKDLGRYGYELTPEQARNQVSSTRLELKQSDINKGKNVTLHDMLTDYYSERKTPSKHDYKPSGPRGSRVPCMQLCYPLFNFGQSGTKLSGDYVNKYLCGVKLMCY